LELIIGLPHNLVLKIPFSSFSSAYAYVCFAKMLPHLVFTGLQHSAVYAVFEQKPTFILIDNDSHFDTAFLFGLTSAENVHAGLAGQMLSCSKSYPAWIPIKVNYGIGSKQAVLSGGNALMRIYYRIVFTLSSNM